MNKNLKKRLMSLGVAATLAAIPVVSNNVKVEKSSNYTTSDSTTTDYSTSEYTDIELNEHIHNFSEEYLVKKTYCDEPGYYGKSCLKCGEIIYTSTVPVFGNDLNVAVDKNATCIKEGQNDNRLSTFEMIQKYKINEMGIDFMGYYPSHKFHPSFHYLIVPYRANGIKYSKNGTLLLINNYRYLHQIDELDRDSFDKLTYEMILINRQGYISNSNLYVINDILEESNIKMNEKLNFNCKNNGKWTDLFDKDFITYCDAVKRIETAFASEPHLLDYYCTISPKFKGVVALDNKLYEDVYNIFKKNGYEDNREELIELEEKVNNQKVKTK